MLPYEHHANYTASQHARTHTQMPIIQPASTHARTHTHTIKVANATLRDSTQTLPRRPLHLKCHTVSQYPSKCNSIDAHKKIRPALSRFSWNSQKFSNITCTASQPEIHTSLKIQKLRQLVLETQLRLYVTCGFKSTDFHETHNHSINFCWYRLQNVVQVMMIMIMTIIIIILWEPNTLCQHPQYWQKHSS
jgi:hypothetical protein